MPNLYRQEGEGLQVFHVSYPDVQIPLGFQPTKPHELCRLDLSNQKSPKLRLSQCQPMRQRTVPQICLVKIDIEQRCPLL